MRVDDALKMYLFNDPSYLGSHMSIECVFTEYIRLEQPRGYNMMFW